MQEEYQRNEHNKDGPGFTLADFINTWAKRWKLFTAILIIFLVYGVVQFKTRPLPPFTYSTTLELGVKGGGSPIEPLEVVQAKLKDAYIPEALAKHAKDNNYREQRYLVEVQNDDKSDKTGKTGQASVSGSVTLNSYGSETAATATLAIHQAIADRLIDDHAQQSLQERRNFEQEKLKAEHALKKLQEQETFLPQKRQQFEDVVSFVRRQIDETHNLIQSEEQDRTRAITSASTKESVDQSLVTTILLLDSTITEHRKQLRALEERLFITLPQERAELDRAGDDLKRQQKEQELALADLILRIENMRVTRLLLVPSQLPQPPLGGVLYQTLAIFGGVGFVLGLFLVSFVEFAAQARKQARGR